MTYRSGSNVLKNWPGLPPNRQFLMTDLLRRASYLGEEQEFPSSASLRDCQNIGISFGQIPRLEVFRHYVKYSEMYSGWLTVDGLFDWLSFLARYFKKMRIGFERVDI